VKGIGIKYQLRLTTLIPVLLVALLFAVFYNGQFGSGLKQHLLRLGKAYIHQLLPAAQLAMLKDDHRALQGLIDASTINPEIQALAFYNANGQLVAYRGGKQSLHNTFNPSKFTGDYVESKQKTPYTINFVAPIILPKDNPYAVTPKNLTPLQGKDILGWLSIDIDTRSMLIQRYQMYIVTIFITLLGLLMGLSIHYILSKRIYLPIARLRRSMKQILSNEFETHIKIASTGELGIIEQGCSHLQKHYLRSVQELNHHIEIATADLQQSLELLEEKNIELSLDKKKSEERSRQKAELIANMSHEIRTPMNGVIGFTNVLLDSKLDPLQLDYVNTIKSSAQDLLSIINDILDYSKMDVGKLHLDCIPLDIRACIDEVLALTAPIAHRKGIDLIPSTAINVPKTMLGDPLRLKQMISNLVSNAIKFTEQGYVLIRTCIEQETERDYSLSISVTDSGIGISADDQTTLFNAFNQADTTITRRYGGSGLGLVICKKLAEQMQGRISIKSEVHKGSTFSIHIKLEKLASYEVEKRQIHRFANLNVICFDDNPLHLEAICNGLGHWGIHCMPVDSFSKLGDAFKTHSNYHLAFVNVNQGCEQQVAELLRQQSIPSVLVSKWFIKDYEALGADGFLFKPPNIQKLHDTIESLINKVALTKTHTHELNYLRQKLGLIKPSLLIAEDNAVNQMLLRSMLGENVQMEMVSDGQQAVKNCSLKRFDVIVLDLQMPLLNGLDAALMIRETSIINQHTPIMLISANSSDLHKNLLPSAGIGPYLQKPIDEETLLRALLLLMNKPNPVAINWALCVQKLSGNHALAQEFMARFIEELQVNREEFLQLMREDNIKGLERAAHKLHGACCFCGVPSLQHHVILVENLAKHARSMNELNAAFSALILSIDDVLSEYKHLNFVQA